MRIRIEGYDPPGRYCGPGPDYPDGHHNVRVAVQGRKGQDDLLGLAPGDLDAPVWELACTVSRPPDPDIRGPQIHGVPGNRFIYLTWGVVDNARNFTMFRRAKLLLGAIPPEVMGTACELGGLTGRLRLAGADGWPVCAAVRPPAITWTAR